MDRKRKFSKAEIDFSDSKEFLIELKSALVLPRKSQKNLGSTLPLRIVGGIADQYREC